MIKIGIVGSRDYYQYQEFSEVVTTFLSKLIPPISFVSGGAAGADSLAEQYAKEHGIEIEIIHPDWNRLGRAAGMIRNKTIIQHSDVVLAFWDGSSKGTANSIGLAKKAGKLSLIFNTKTKTVQQF